MKMNQDIDTMEKLTCDQLASNFDYYMGMVEEGTSYLIDEKVVLTDCSDLDFLNDHYDAC